MANAQAMAPAELLALEERQLFYFLTDVRPVGEEKSELYPEPQYFSTAFVATGAQIAPSIDRILEKTGSAQAYAQGLQRVLSTSTALHMSGLGFISTWGREMWLMDDPDADRNTGIIADGAAPTLSDHDIAKSLRFSYDVVTNYRQDGRAHPHPSAALGDDYRILSEDDAERVAARTAQVASDQADDVMGLLAAVRALSFLMEAETREALMMHGPYPTGEDGHQLVVFECQDLHWSMFPNFPIPGGARWSLPEKPFPVANLAIAMVLRDCEIKSDRFGTIYVQPWDSENLVAAALLTRGSDEFTDEGLSDIPLAEAKPLRRHCDDIQEFMFLQIAQWDQRQRMGAGVYQEQMLPLRIMSAAGYTRAEIEAEQQRIHRENEPIINKLFDRCFERSAEELPFFAKLEAFAMGKESRLFTPLAL